MVHTDPMPIVGWTGGNNTIRVITMFDRTICQPTVAHALFVLLMTTLFGPFLSASLLAIAVFNSVSALPAWPIMGCVVFMNVIAWTFFVQAVLVQPRIEILAGSGDVLAFRQRRGAPVLQLPRHTIEDVRIRMFDFVDLGKFGAEVAPVGHAVAREHLVRRRITNFVLTVHTSAGSRHDLCVSPDEALIRTVMSKLQAVPLERASA